MANISIVLNAKDNASHVISGAGEVITGAFRRIGEMGINALASAGGALVNFAKDSFAGAIEAQAGIDKLTASITSLGDKSPVTMAGAEALADQFKNLVGGSDDAVLAMVEMATRFDKISADTFPQFIEQSADLAAKLGIDPVKAAQILGKTLQDMSVDGVGSLGKLKTALGIEFTEAQDKAVLSMVEAGNAAGAQAMLFDILAEKTGGAAEIAATSAAGQWKIFQEQIADAGEGVALKLLPSLTALAAQVLPPLTDAVMGVTDAAGYFVDVLMRGGGLNEALDGLASFSWEDFLGPQVGEMVYAVIAALQNLPLTLAPIMAGFDELVVSVTASLPMIQTTFSDVFTYISGFIAEVMPVIVANVGQALAELAVFWSAHGAEIMAVVGVAFEIIAATIGTTLALVTGIISAALQLINGDWEGAWTTIETTLSTVMDNILGIAETSLDEFLATWEHVFTQIALIVTAGLLSASQAAQATIDGFIGIGQALAQGIADGISAGAQWIADAAAAAARAAVDAAKGFLGIHSPSRVFAGLGENMMAGMAQGIAGASYMPSNAMLGAAGNTYSSAMNVTMNINGAGSPGATGAEVRRQLDALGRSADGRMRTR